MGAGIDNIIDAQLERVNEVKDALNDGLYVLTWVHLVIFPLSWTGFYWIGKMYFEKYLGVYHATSAKHWSTLCKLIFLLTFVAACNLLELMVFEILNLLPPALRRLAWSSTFSILCVLLNNIIPFVGAATMGRTLGLRRSLYIMLGIGCVVFMQIWFWIVGETFITDSSESWKDHSSPSVIVFLWNQVLLTDVQHSIALIAMMGTGVAAVVAGFTTVSFPLEQLMIVRGVNFSILRAKERFHVDLLRAIARKKRERLKKRHLGAMVSSIPNAISHGSLGGASADKSSTRENGHRYREIFHELSNQGGNIQSRFCKAFINLWRPLDVALMGVLREQVDDTRYRKERRKSKFRSSLAPEFWSIEADNERMYNLVSLSLYDDKVDVFNLEQRAQETFLDITSMHELQRQIKFSKTAAGKMLWMFGLWMSLIAILRLVQGILNVGGYLWFRGYQDLIEEEQSDFDYMLVLLESALKIHLYNWSLILHCVFVGALGLMQIRAFLGTMGQLARRGILSTNTELYALLLAYLSGFYFIASIVLLRMQLPLHYRKGVTVALGPFGFDFFAWIFDCIFVISTTLTALGLVKTYAFKRI